MEGVLHSAGDLCWKQAWCWCLQPQPDVRCGGRQVLEEAQGLEGSWGRKVLLLLGTLLLTGALTGFPKAGLAFLITLQYRALWRLAWAQQPPQLLLSLY